MSKIHRFLQELEAREAKGAPAARYFDPALSRPSGRGLSGLGDDPSLPDADAATRHALSEDAKAALALAKSGQDARGAASSVRDRLVGFLSWADSSWGVFGPSYDSSQQVKDNLSDAEQISLQQKGGSVRALDQGTKPGAFTSSGAPAPAQTSDRASEIATNTVLATPAGIPGLNLVPGVKDLANRQPDGTIGAEGQQGFDKQHPGLPLFDPQFSPLPKIVDAAKKLVDDHWGKALLVAGAVLFVASGGGQVVGALASHAKKNPKKGKKK